MASLSNGTGIAEYFGVVWVVYKWLHVITKQGNQGNQLQMSGSHPGANAVRSCNTLGTKSWPICWTI